MAFLHKIGYNKEKTEGFIMKNFKKGFTIAEVIVTLVLIGIVAAISIPSIYINHQKRVDRTRIKNAIVTFDSLIREVDISLGRAATTANIKDELINRDCQNLPNHMTIVYNKGCIVSTPDGTWWDFTQPKAQGNNNDRYPDLVVIKVAPNEKELNNMTNPITSYPNGAYFLAQKTRDGLQINNVSLMGRDGDGNINNNADTTKIINNLEKFKGTAIENH